MANTIKLKRGTSTPSTSDISNGEVAIDTSAQKLYINDSGTVKEIGSGGIGGASGLDFNDNVKVRFGTGNDLEIYHDGSNSYITNGTGELQIRATHYDQAVTLNPDGAVELFYDASKKLQTTSSGVNIGGNQSTNPFDFLRFGASLFGAADIRPTNEANHKVGLSFYTDGTNDSLNPVERLRITSSGNVNIANDSGKLQLGASQDLKIYHDGTHSYIKDTGTGNLVIQTNILGIQSANGLEDLAKFTQDGSVELYHNNNKKLETSTYGTTLTGNLFLADSSDGNWGRIKVGTGEDLQIYHDGSESVIGNSTGTFQFLSPNEIRYRATTHHFLSYGNDETMAKFNDDGAVELYYDNSKKLETFANGIKLYDTQGDLIGEGFDGGFNFTSLVYVNELRLMDSEKIQLGDGQDLQIYHDPAYGHSFIKESGSGGLIIGASVFEVYNAAISEKIISATADGGVELYYDNSKKFETHSGGVAISSNGAAISPSGYDLKIRSNTCKLGIHTDNASDLPTLEFGTGNVNGGKITTSSVGAIQICPNNTEEARFLSGGGLTFNGDTATANALDDYEEGTYTPTLTAGSGDYTLNSSYNILQYTKVGRMMHVSGRVRITAKNSATGDYIHMSLPTTSASPGEDAGRITGVCYVQYSGKAVNDFIVLPTIEGNSYVQLAHVDYDGTGFNDMNAQFDGNELVAVSITYIST